MTSPLNVLGYAGTLPTIAAAPLAAHEGHAVIGRVTIGSEARLGAGSVLRADGHYVSIGDGFNLGRGATVHIAHDRYPTIIGDRVHVGANAVVHACTVGDDVVIESGAIVLDGAVVGSCCVVEAGSVVYPRAVLVPGMWYSGRPARLVRPLLPGELGDRAELVRLRNETASINWICQPLAATASHGSYVANTAELIGETHLAERSSIWFSCRFNAQAGPIHVGADCNVQDNTVITAGSGGMRIGEGTTIGHNVQLVECSVGSRCLVGIGSRIARGTIIDDDCFVAGGAVTQPGQRLRGGVVWGGDPARPIGQLDDAKRAIIRETADIYSNYAREMSSSAAGASRGHTWARDSAPL